MQIPTLNKYIKSNENKCKQMESSKQMHLKSLSYICVHHDVM